MRAGLLAALALFACASPPAPRGAEQPAKPRALAERIPALERLPADTLFVAATADLAATAAALGWPDVLARFGDAGPRLSAKLRSALGHDLLQPSAWAEIGIDAGGPAGLAVLPGEDLVLVVFVELEDSYRFQTFLHESKDVLGPLRTRTEAGGMVVEFGRADELGAVIRGEHGLLVFADDDDELGPALSRLAGLRPAGSLARDPAFLAVQKAHDADVGVYAAFHRIADQVQASTRRRRARAENHASYLARLEAEQRLAEETLRPIGGVAAELWLEARGLRLEARADVRPSSIWARLFRPAPEPTWRAVPGGDDRVALRWAAALEPEAALALARLVAGANGDEVAEPDLAGLLRNSDAASGAARAIAALPDAARALLDEPAALRLVLDLRRAVVRQKQAAPIAAPPKLGPNASPQLRELVARYQRAAAAWDRAQVELLRAAGAEVAETAAIVGTTVASLQREGQRWTLRALQVGMAEGPEGLLAVLIDAEIEHSATRRAIRSARERYWQAEGELYQVSREIELIERSEAAANKVVLGADASGAAGLDKDTIAKVVRAQLPAVRHCYEQQLVNDPQLEGKVVVSFTIGPDGIVAAARVSSSTLGHGATEACIVDVVAKMRFPRPEGGSQVVVNYPFLLHAAQ